MRNIFRVVPKTIFLEKETNFLNIDHGLKVIGTTVLGFIFFIRCF